MIEFDDFFNLPSFVFPSVITWKYPTTLNGAILSYLRDPSLKELKMNESLEWQLKVSSFLGYYLRKYERRLSR